jgi:hypothetical protein
MLTLHKDSHIDHGLTQPQIDFLISRFADRNGFFIETVELPESLGTVPCGLYGPLMGDPEIQDRVCEGCGVCSPCTWFNSGALCHNPILVRGQAYKRVRGNRAYLSRVIDAPMRQVRTVTVIAGEHDGSACVLYTAFGGPLTPQEPGDPTCKDPAKSKEFWSKHALAIGESTSH